MRLDAAVFHRGLSKSRSRAKCDIEAGCVYVNGKQITKPAFEVSVCDEISLPGGGALSYVSRGALKLKAALEGFGIDVRGLECADIGASAGGFTDCLIQRGARRVYAVDCGSNQLDPILRADSRVISIENFNARALMPDTFGTEVDCAVMDLSFISQTLVLPAVTGTVRSEGFIISLVKPQFECGRAALSKNGIVKNPAEHLRALNKVCSCAERCGLILKNSAVSPILGSDGNREYLLHFVKSDGEQKKFDFGELVKR